MDKAPTAAWDQIAGDTGTGVKLSGIDTSNQGAGVGNQGHGLMVTTVKEPVDSCPS